MAVAARHIDIITEEITCTNRMSTFLAYPIGGGRSRRCTTRSIRQSCSG
jgi:hypothetical protein